MPDSQENEWQHLGYTSGIEVSEENFDELTEYVRQSIQSMRAMYVPITNASASITRLNAAFNNAEAEQAQLIRETQAMAINTNHREYPAWDSYGTYWYDPSGFHSDDPHVCFICSRPTSRIDIDFHGAFCNSEECNEVIVKDLERLNGGPEVRD